MNDVCMKSSDLCSLLCWTRLCLFLVVMLLIVQCATCCLFICHSLVLYVMRLRCIGCITDVKDVGYVINYDFPNNCEDYIHRIGRTGRAGMKGTSYTYFTTDNSKSARELISILREAKADVPQQLEEMAMYSGGGGGRSRYGGGGRGRGGGGGGGRYGGGGGGGHGEYGGARDRW